MTHLIRLFFVFVFVLLSACQAFPLNPDGTVTSDQSVAEPSLKSILWNPKVKPWQKRYLAKDSMKPEGPLASGTAFQLKIHQSKEGSRGGVGVGGSGCGCN